MSAEIQCSFSEKCKVVLLDVAGTTTAINFIKEKLFPFAVSQAESYLKTNWEDDAVKEAVKNLNPDKELDISAAVETIKELTEKNSENVGLKTLQGLFFKKGYEDGELKAPVFADVPAALESWSKVYSIAIYSTGSEESQKLLFSHSTEGNLASHITKYFDQSVGPKTDSASYEKIASNLDLKTDELTFITDIAEEAKAAKKAGVSAILVEREGNQELTEEEKKEFPVIKSFADISSANPAKRKNEEETDAVETPPAKLPKTEETEKAPEAVSEATAKTEENKVENEETATVEVAEEAMEVDSEETAVKGAKTEEDANAKPITATEKPAEEAEAVEKVEKETKEDKTEEDQTDLKTEKEDNKPVEKEQEHKAEPKKEEEKEPKKDEEVVAKDNEKLEKAEEVKEATDAKEPEVEPKDAKPEEPKIEAEEKKEETVEKEKENKSDIANGVAEPEKSCDNEEVNGKAAENGDKEEETEEIKVKKIEETEDKTPVSVECA